MGRDYHEAGMQSATLAARVMRGERPGDIPFENVGKTRLVVNPGSARHIGLTLPASLVARADRVVGAH
jgi:putative ABC transport system substrate-binding protein